MDRARRELRQSAHRSRRLARIDLVDQRPEAGHGPIVQPIDDLAHTRERLRLAPPEDVHAAVEAFYELEQLGEALLEVGGLIAGCRPCLSHAAFDDRDDRIRLTLEARL